MKKKILSAIALVVYLFLGLLAMAHGVPNSARVTVAFLLVLTGLPWLLLLIEKKK